MEKLRVWSQQFPPAPRDQPLQAGLAPLGVTDPEASPYPSLSDEERAALVSELERRQGCAAPGPRLRSQSRSQRMEVTLHAFDYNLDFFEVGALDDDQFKIADPKLRIVSEPPPRWADCGATTRTRRRTS